MQFKLILSLFFGALGSISCAQQLLEPSYVDQNQYSEKSEYHSCTHRRNSDYTPPSFPQPQSKSILTNPTVYVQSIHNVIAKWDAGSVYRFDIGTMPGGDDIYNGHLLWATDKHTIGHSFQELQNYATAQGTTFNIGDVFYLNLYENNTTLDTAFQCQFLWEDLGNVANNITLTIETNYGLNGAPPFATWQATQMMDFYNLVNPILRDIYGPPARNHNINIVNDAYSTGTNTYYNGPNQVNTSYSTNAYGDLDQPRLMVHELVHAYRDNVSVSSNDEWHYAPELSGFEEGMAEAVAIVVMNRFAELYPNFWNGEEFRIRWNHARGMPFEWDYDFQNHKQLTTHDYFSSDIATGSHWLRYGTGATAMRKIYIEDPDFFKNFNAAYYAALNADHLVVPSRSMIANLIANVKPQIERTPALTWIDQQHIFDCTIDLGKKVFMLSFTGLSWNSFQHDNRIHFMETHSNGLEWQWNSSDQAGTNEVSDGAANADWAWTHQLNNVPGTIDFVRNWNNTVWGNKAIINNGHWVTDNGGPNAGGTLLGPNQGPNPYYVGPTFTRDHEQDNCTAVPGCGKRAWAIGSQNLYTSTSTAANMWPPIVSQGGTIPDQRVELNMNESGLFQFNITFNDPSGPSVQESYYRLLGDNFISWPNKGLIGGIYSPTQSLVDGRMFIEHKNHGEEVQLPLSNNSFKGNRTWTSILETQVQFQGGRTDRRYSDPGEVHAIYLNPDCSQKKIDFRTIGYGDGLDGTEMLLFNKDEFEDILFTESPDIVVPPGGSFSLAITNNFPDILNDDSRIYYEWLDPLGNSISTDTNYLFTNAQPTDAGTYLVAVDFFGCPTFNLEVEVSIAIPLPVEIIEFNAELANNDDVDLTWSTASESNNAYFTIEKSASGEQWTFVDNVDAVGNSSTLQNYRTIDAEAYEGTSYYRLTQVDNDGTETIAGIDLVTKQMEFILHPNPVQNELNLGGKNIQNAHVRCFNALGQEIELNTLLEKGRLIIATNSFSNGVYMLEVHLDNNVQTLRFVVQK